MRNTAIFLAEQWVKTEKVIYHSFSLPRSEAIEYIMDNYPIIQGTKNKMRLHRLSELTCLPYEIAAEIDAVMPAKHQVINSGHSCSTAGANTTNEPRATPSQSISQPPEQGKDAIGGGHV